MRLIEFFEKTRVRLDELRLRTPYPSEKNYSVLVAGPYMWILDELNGDDSVLNDINDKLGISDSKIQVNDISDLQDLADEYPEVIYAHVHDGTMYVNNLTINHHPASSPALKKLANTLGINEISTDSEMTYDPNPDIKTTFYKRELKGDLPDWAYHGTNTAHMRSILTKGLIPNSEVSNWESAGVGKFDLVFLTMNIEKAVFHSKQSMRGLSGVFPVILKVKIPEKNRIVIDYDVASQMQAKEPYNDELGYTSSSHFGFNYSSPLPIGRPKDLSKMTGIFGYKGRIPANHIMEIYADFSDEAMDVVEVGEETSFHTFNDIKGFLSAYEIAQEFGYWEPGMEEELEAMRQEDEEDDY